MQVLVIIVSATLTVFLIISIFALVKIIQVLNDIKRITKKAEHIADSAEHVGKLFKYSAGPVAVAKLLANVSEAVFGNSKRKGKKNE